MEEKRINQIEVRIIREKQIVIKKSEKCYRGNEEKQVGWSQRMCVIEEK